MDLIYQLLLLTVAGFACGFIGSQVGAGAIFTVPALLYLGLPLPLAISSQALSGEVVNGLAAYRYWQKKQLDFKTVWPYSLIAAVGAFIGAKLLFIVNLDLVPKVFAAVFVGLLILLFVKPDNPKSRRRPKNARLIGSVIATVIGIYGGMLAVGVTTLAIFFFQVIMGRHRLHAVADSMFIVAVLQAVQLAVFIADGHINYTYAFALVPGTMLGTVLGTKVILNRGVIYFKLLMVVATVIVVAKLLV